jgi:hypothetical protein
VLLEHAPDRVRDAYAVHAMAEPALETVGVEETHEELEVRLLAVAGRGRIAAAI